MERLMGGGANKCRGLRFLKLSRLPPLKLTKLCAFVLIICAASLLAALSFSTGVVQTVVLHAPPKALIHMVWVGLAPFSPIALATIDSVTRHRPNAKLKLHMPIEDELPAEVFEGRKVAFMKQVNFFRDRGFDLEPVFYENVTSLLGGTVLENIGIKQRHMGGLYNSPTERAHSSHVSDIIRQVVVYKEGGAYIDTDCIQLNDMGPLLELLQPLYITTDESRVILNKEDPGEHHLNCGVFAATPSHPFLLATMMNVRGLIVDKGADCWFPWRIGLDDTCGWNDIGPKAFTIVHKEWCANKTNPLPLVVNPGDLKTLGSAPSFMQPLPQPPPYIIVSPAIVSPLHWSHEQFFQAETSTVATEPELLKHFAEKIIALADTYQIHVFKPHKDHWTEMLDNPLTYPLVKYVHHFSCNHFCKVSDFKNFLEEHKRSD